MYKIFLLFAFAVILFQGCEKTNAQENTPEKQEIEKVVNALVEAFNQHDQSQLEALWAPDSTYINLTTEESYTGNDNIADFFKKQAGAKLKINLSTVYFPSNEEAIAKGIAEITNQDNHTDKSAFIAQYVHENGKWLISSFSVNELNPPISHYEQLKDLEWLIGDWQDDDENIDVTYHITWDKNKNFIMENFILSILENEELSGMQVIGWDPISKNIISWTFDSDGGFGQSKWNRENDTWYADVLFTMPQGGKATATHILTKVDNDTFTFASVNRDVDGKLLPNIGPFKVVRKK